MRKSTAGGCAATLRSAIIQQGAGGHPLAPIRLADLKTTLLMIPGMMLGAGLYSSQLASLGKAFQIAIADISQSDSVEAIAASVLASAPARFGLVGMSMGGIVALELVKRSPHRVSHLALISTTPYADPPERRATRAEQMARVREGRLLDVIRETVAQHYFSNRNRSDPSLNDEVTKMAQALGADVFIRQSIALRDREDSFRMLRSITCPTVVLCGREDALCPVAVHGEMAAAIGTADFTILSDAGHLAILERPEAVNWTLRHLMSRTQ